MIKRGHQITDRESIILKHIEDNELSKVSFTELKSSLGFTTEVLQDMIIRLIRNEHLLRIKRGIYCTRSFKNPYIIANILLEDSTVAYWSALNIHGLSEQIPNVVFSQSIKLKPDKTVFNVRYKFVKVKPEKMFGKMQMGYGNEAFQVTDVEKTLLDCFDLPQYSGGYEELIRAFHNAKISSIRLLYYGKRMGNLSVLKRMAFLSELFEMKGFTRFRQGVKAMLNDKYTLIDPFGDNVGEFVSKWRLRLNIPRDNLLGMIQKMY